MSQTGRTGGWLAKAATQSKPHTWLNALLAPSPFPFLLLQAFQAVQQKRYDAFMQAFEHVAHRIDPIYKASNVWLGCCLVISGF